MNVQHKSNKDIHALLTRGMESGLHWFPEDVSVSQLAVVFAGMANSSGGIIVLGIAPRSNRIQGVRDQASAFDKVFQAALLTDPTLVLPLPKSIDVDGQQLIWITIPSGLPHVYSLDGRYLGRIETRTQPLTARQLRRLLIERGVVQIESQIPPDASLDDLDPDKVNYYISSLNMPSNETVEQVLLRRGCLRPVNSGASEGELRPTYAALLLFGKSPQQWVPNATILAARFAGSTMADEFIKQDIRGTLSDQLRQAEVFVRDHLRRVVRLVGLTRQEVMEYPLEAVRELLVNAVAHRDYNIQGDNIHLNIFADRIEVHSPGGLPGPVTLDNLLEARFSRNPVIAQILSDQGFVERLGYGLDRVVEVVRSHGLPSPRFEEVVGSFRVSLLGDRGQTKDVEFTYSMEEELNPRQQSALSFLIRNRRITNRDYQDLCPEVSSETLRRDLVDLVDRNLLIKIGDKRATYYILKR